MTLLLVMNLGFAWGTGAAPVAPGRGFARCYISDSTRAQAEVTDSVRVKTDVKDSVRVTVEVE